MGNLSAGMKQLAATSLLWALKNLFSRPMPIIVDTPWHELTKEIKRTCCSIIIREVSEQVILLPTDSEMDERKYNFLKPYIYQEYVLDNKSGTKSQPCTKNNVFCIKIVSMSDIYTSKKDEEVISRVLKSGLELG